jgi:hypothetical protein
MGAAEQLFDLAELLALIVGGCLAYALVILLELIWGPA